jgi:multidrug efflux pump subunit AcrA (membrane-fusion protein)
MNACDPIGVITQETRSPLFRCLILCLASLLSLPLTAQAQQAIGAVDEDTEILGIAKFGRRAELTFGTAGQITWLPFDEGERVEQGQVVATLYDKTAEAALQEASQRAAAQGALLTAKAQLSAAKARLAAVQRANSNYAQAFSPQAVRDLYEAVDVATEALRQQVELIKIAEAGEHTAKCQLEALRLVAPFNGTIVRRLKSVGEGVDPVSPVYELIDDARVRIEFFVPEERLNEFAVDSQIMIKAIGRHESKFKPLIAKVKFLDLSVQPVRRVVRAWTELDRPDWIMDGTRLKIEASSITHQDGAAKTRLE